MAGLDAGLDPGIEGGRAPRFVIPNAARSTRRHPGQAKREPGSQKGWRFNLLRSRIRLRFSGTTAARSHKPTTKISPWKLCTTPSC